MALIKCSECSSDVSEEASVCPKCGCPVEVSVKDRNDRKKRKMKYLVIASICLVVAAIAVAGIVIFINRPDKSGYYNGFKWGMSFEEVRKKLGDEAIINEDKKTAFTTGEDYDGKKGVTSMVLYKFEGDSLNQITLYLNNTDESDYSNDTFKKDLSKKYDKLYGKHEQDGLYSWMTAKSKIEMIDFGNGLLVISYKNLNDEA